MEPRAWREAWVTLHSIAVYRAKRYSDRLTGLDLDEIANAAMDVAMAKITAIRSVEALKAFVATTAEFKAKDRIRSLDVAKKREMEMVSLEAKIESTGDFDELASDQQPDDALKHAEFVVICRELFRLVPPEELAFISERAIHKLTDREIGEKYGWNRESVTSRRQQACRRACTVLKSDKRAVKLLRELGREHYLDE